MDGDRCVVTQFAESVQGDKLGELGELATSFDDRHIAIMNALDMLMAGV